MQHNVPAASADDQPVPCAVCGTHEATVRFSGRDRLTPLDGTFTLVTCSRCGTVRQNPQPAWSILAQHYPDGDYVAYQDLESQQTSKWKAYVASLGVRRKRKALAALRRHGTLLDIGCGTGRFLSEMQRHGGWSLFGLEPNRFAADYVRQTLNIPVVNGVFPSDSAEIANQTFDIITMWNVLEHLEQPRLAVRAVAKQLAPRGWFVFSVPNLESVDATLAGPHWVGWDLPRHLYIFPRRTLANMLREEGFRVARMRCLTTSYHALGLTLRWWAAARAETHGQQAATDRLVDAYHSLPVRLATMPYFGLLDRLKRGSFITVFAQKDA